MSETCMYCGGLKMEQGKTYGWAGKVCSCGSAPQLTHFVESRPAWVFEILTKLETIEKLLSEKN